MEYIDLRKAGKEGLKQIRSQVVRLKKMGKSGREIEELVGVRQNRVSEIWTAYQREGESSFERKKYGRKPGAHMLLEAWEQEEIRQAVVEKTPEDFGIPGKLMVYQGSMNQQRLIQFMQRLIRTSERKVFLILDNLRVHHGKLVKAWLEKHKEKIEAFFLPPYAPEYNPDEYLNHALKLSVHTGNLPYTVQDISHKIHSFMRRLQHNPSLVMRFFLHPRLSYLSTGE